MFRFGRRSNAVLRPVSRGQYRIDRWQWIEIDARPGDSSKQDVPVHFDIGLRLDDERSSTGVGTRTSPVSFRSVAGYLVQRIPRVPIGDQINGSIAHNVFTHFAGHNDFSPTAVASDQASIFHIGSVLLRPSILYHIDASARTESQDLLRSASQRHERSLNFQTGRLDAVRFGYGYVVRSEGIMRRSYLQRTHHHSMPVLLDC